MFKNETDIIKINFFKYLSALGVSTKTHKNYRSDLNYFFAWISADLKTIGKEIETFSDCVPFLGNSTVVKYKFFLTENKIPFKTVNRRLSTLRHLAKFLVAEQILATDFTFGIENVGLIKMQPKSKVQYVHLASDFQGYLEANKISKNTVKNYVSDVKHFLSWLEVNHQVLDTKF